MIQNITEVIIEIYRTRNISASSYIEWPKKYKNSESILNLQSDDVFCFSWCILAHKYPVPRNKSRPTKYSNYLSALNMQKTWSDARETSRKIPKFEKLNKLNVNVFELLGSVLSPVHFNTIYTEPQID